MSDHKAQVSHQQYQFHDYSAYFKFNGFDPDRVHQKLPPAVYELRAVETPSGIDLRLQKRDPLFDVPQSTRFGRHLARLEIISNRYSTGNPSMGVLMVGLKGAGKSLFAEDLGNVLITRDAVPVIMVTEPLPASMIREVIKSVGPCMVYFDEYGKTYSKIELREKLLPLFSDSDMRGVLFVITGNHFGEFNDAVMDRPGRFRYRMQFDGLSPEMVMEVAKARGLSDQLAVALVRYCRTHQIGYDTLVTVADIIKGCQTEDEIKARLEIINVPKWAISGVHVTRLLEGETRLKFDDIDYDGEKLTVTALSGEKNDVERKIEIPLLETVELYGDKPIEVKFGEFTLTVSSHPVYSDSASRAINSGGNRPLRPNGFGGKSRLGEHDFTSDEVRRHFEARNHGFNPSYGDPHGQL